MVTLAPRLAVVNPILVAAAELEPASRATIKDWVAIPQLRHMPPADFPAIFTNFVSPNKK